MISLEDFYIGIKYDYTNTKFFFTVKQPVEEIEEDAQSVSFYLEIDGTIAEKPCILLYSNGMKLGNEYVWQTLVHQDNLWKDYLKLHANENIEVTVHQDEDIHLYTPTLYYYGDKIERGQCTVPLPNIGWQIGAYDIDVVYPTTRQYNTSSLSTQLAYKTWNWFSRIYCEGADENGRILMYPSDETELVFNVVDKDNKPVNSGDIEVVISDVYAETQIYGMDLTIEEGIEGELGYTITTISDNPELVPTGEVLINQDLQSIEITGDITDISEWVSSQSIATANVEYIPASTSNNKINSGKNCVSYWKRFTLIPETSISFSLDHNGTQEFAFGLIDVTTQRALFTIKYNPSDESYSFIQEESTTEHAFAPNLIDNSLVLFYYTRGQIVLEQHNTTDIISTADHNYYFFLQGYDTLSAVKCTHIKGGYGDEI